MQKERKKSLTDAETLNELKAVKLQLENKINPKLGLVSSCFSLEVLLWLFL